MAVGKCEVEFRDGCAFLTVDGTMLAADIRVTFKRDGSLSTLRVGNVREFTSGPFGMPGSTESTGEGRP
jgi:hypothetical protein